ncbi:putative plasmid stabilization protein [Pseudomonas aeruginosa]|nr:putative plasmid stabilization protein [Pseudomonas aeruginosa]
MAKYRISHDAQADIIDILRFTHNRFGDPARRRYQALIGRRWKQLRQTHNR